MVFESTKGLLSMHRNALRLLVAATLLAPLPLTHAQTRQQGSSSSNSTPAREQQDSSSTPRARIAQPEASGSAITLETSESLFYVAAALNACGYDAGPQAPPPPSASPSARR